MQERNKSNTKIDFRSNAFKKYFKNTSWLLLERVTRLTLNFLITIYVIRYLGPENFGLLSYAISFAALFNAIASLGLDNIIIRELVKEPEESDTLLGSVFIMKIFGAVSSYIFIIITVYIIQEPSQNIFLILLVAASTIFQSFNVIEFYFQSKVQAKFPVFVQFGTSVLLAVIKFIFIQLNADLWLFALAIALESFFWAFGFIIVYQLQRLKIFNWKFQKNISFSLLKDSWPLLLSGVVITIYMKVDQVMIKKMLDNEQVGLYAAAVRISEAWYFIPMVIVNSLFPAIINAKKKDESLYLNRLQKLYDLLAWLSIGIALSVTIFSGTIVNLILGEEFIASANVLTIHIWAGVAVFLGVASSQFLITENLTKLSFYRTFIGMILNVILNYILIPEYGIIGAAVATLISFTLSTFSIGINKKTFPQLKMMIKSITLINLFYLLKRKWQFH